MSKIFSQICFALFLVGFGAKPVAATPPNGGCPKQEFTKNINREFGTVADGTTALYNKYGKVTVNTWQNNSVKIDITIVVNASDQRSADKVFNRINVNFTNTAGYVKAETVISPENKGWMDWVDGNTCQDFKINYAVWMPISNQLDLKNKYGDSYVSQLNGKLLAEIKYGDLRTENINNHCELSLGYGKANMNSMQNLSGQVSYGELTLTTARDIELDTKYSDVNFQQAGDVRLVSKYDDFTIGNVASLRLQTKYSDVILKSAQSIFITTQYTDLKIGSIITLVDADMNYGVLVVENLNRNFNEVRLNGKYTDFKVEVERGAAFRFDAEGSYTDLKTPSGATVQNKNQHGSWETVKGFVGEENAKGLVKAKLTYGDFVLK